MADKEEEVVVKETTEEAEEVQEDQAETPETMDEIIEKEAEAELDKERGEEDGKPEESEPSEDDESDAEAEAEESDETDVDGEAEPEEEPEEVEEAEPIDTSSFREAGLEAVPEDYKPQSWSAFMKDVVEVFRGEVNKETRAVNEQQEAFQAEVNKVDEGWQAEIAELQKSGDIPKGKEGESATKAVFEYMAENNKKYENNPNKQIWSFETAHKLMNASKVTDERAEEIKTRRKARASATATSGNSEGGSGIPRLNKGESMDDIIARELNL